MYYAPAGLGATAMTEVEKSSHSIMEQAFYTKLGPTPDLPSSPAKNGRIKPDSNVVRRGAIPGEG
jgi:hypothetical protein